jgi:hypothetical protein
MTMEGGVGENDAYLFVFSTERATYKIERSTYRLRFEECLLGSLVTEFCNSRIKRIKDSNGLMLAALSAGDRPLYGLLKEIKNNLISPSCIQPAGWAGDIGGAIKE